MGQNNQHRLNTCNKIPDKNLTQTITETQVNRQTPTNSNTGIITDLNENPELEHRVPSRLNRNDAEKELEANTTT